MFTALSALIPCISSRFECAEPHLAVSRTATERLEALADTCRLGTKGTQALMQWTCWLAYAATQANDPHILDVPGWKAILPIDTQHAQERLYQVLLRAGESRQTALRTAIKCYPNMQSDLYALQLLPRPLRGEGLGDGIAAFTTKDLPMSPVPFESLPTWAREMALSATDLTGRSLAGMTGVAGLDLRFLNFYCADLGGLDLRNCDFRHADMRGASIAYADIGRARMDESIGIAINGKRNRSYAPSGYLDTWRGTYRGIEADFFHDREILKVLPVIRTRHVEGIDIGYLEDGKSVIQQQARRACTAGAAAMLIADHGGNIDTDELTTRNLGDDDDILMDLEGATDHTPITSHPKTIKMLADQLAKHGPAIVSVSGEIGNHAIIVDGIDLKNHVADLRDPYHGWAIQVPLVAFTGRWTPGSEPIIQLAAPDAKASPPPALWA